LNVLEYQLLDTLGAITAKEIIFAGTDSNVQIPIKTDFSTKTKN
jgi:hypothetical protein